MLVQDRRRHHIIEFLLGIVALLCAFFLTVKLRVLANPVAGLQFTEHQAGASAPPFAVILTLWAAVILRFRMYRSSHPVGFLSSLYKVGESTLAVGIVTVLVTFFSRQLGTSTSGSFVILLIPVSFLCLALSRVVSLGLALWSERLWPRGVRVALIGNISTAARMVRNAGRSSGARYIHGLIVPREEHVDVDADAPLPILGSTAQLAEVVNREHLEQVILLNGSLSGDELEACNQVLTRMGVTLRYAVDVAREPVRLKLTTQYGLPMVEMVPLRFTRTQEMLKRGFDILVASTALILLAPILLVIALLVKLTSDGPVLYRSFRVGKGGRYFRFLKFRSMFVDADRRRLDQGNEKNGHIYKMRNDPRVTPLGRILRRYSLDELPQLVNVLRGEMSIVGPRPLPSGDVDPDGMSTKFSRWAEGRSGVQPGITGLWQISGRSDLSFDEMVRLDLEYIEKWSLMLDIKIILETPMLVLKGMGAY